MLKKEFFELCDKNLDAYRSTGENKSEFSRLLKANYPDLLNDKGLDTIRNYVAIYFRTFPILDKPKSIIEAINLEKIERAENSKIKELKAKSEYLSVKLEESERRYDDLLNIKEPIEILIFEPTGKTSKVKDRATPIISLSDWHIEETVEAGVVSGFNEYNIKIAEKRAINLFINLLKVNNIFSKDVNISEVVLWLGGDFISGYIHDELIENNQLSPMEATRMAKRLLRSGIDYILKHTSLKLIIPCSVGNHGRSTKKMQPSTGYKNNYEFMMYCDLQDYYQGNKRVTFHIPISDDCYILVHNKINRFFHGQQIKYGGGIGGITIPLQKYIHRKNQQQHADYNFLGHFHELLYPTFDSCVNSSLIGLASYGYTLGFKAQTPAQAYTLLDEKKGYTIKTPIFCSKI